MFNLIIWKAQINKYVLDFFKISTTAYFINEDFINTLDFFSRFLSKFR